MKWCVVTSAAAALTLLVVSPVAAQEVDPSSPEPPPPGEAVLEEEGATPPDEAAPEGEPEGETAPEDGASEPVSEPVAEPEPEPEGPVVQEAPIEPEVSEPVEPSPPPAAAAPAEPGPGEEDAETERLRVGSEEIYGDALPFRNTRLVYENIFNAYQLNRGSELSYNPYYAMSLSIQPRWYFTDALSARLRLDVETELTNADDTTDYHETRVSDLNLDLVYDPIVEIPVAGITVGAGFRFGFPTSPESQAATRYLGLGPELRLARVFPVLDGLLLAYNFRYQKYLNRYTTLQRETNPYGCTREEPYCEHGQAGDYARSHGFFNTITLSLDFLRGIWRPMNFSVMVSFMNYLTYEPTDTTVTISGGQEVRVPTDPDSLTYAPTDPVTHQAAIWYVFELGLEITDYLAVALGASTLSPQLAPDSSYRTPFFNRYTNLYVDLTLDVERLVSVFRR